ncbi:hypothetical protein DPMN_183753, partial [Dreissena polymorpha]
ILTALHGLVTDLTPTSNGLKEGSAQRDWLKKVSFYRPVVETILTLTLPDGLQPNCKPLSTQTKSMWDKIVVMKLFLENVCSDETENKINITFSMTLWKLLGNEVNMKEIGTFNKVETFLKQCNKKACSDCQGYVEMVYVILLNFVKCDLCEADFTSVPLSLPCSKMHAVCETCFREMKANKDTSCPKCHEDLGKEWKAIKDIKKKIGNEKLEKYQQRCNTFFIEILTQLSLLLQLLLRTSDESYILGYLKRHLEQIKSAGSTSPIDVVGMYLLIINCWEDIMLQQFQKDDRLNFDKVYKATEKIRVIHNAQKSSEIEFTDQLYCVASTRACLKIAARCLFKITKSKCDCLFDNKEHYETYLCLAIHREIAGALLCSLEPLSSQNLKTLTESIQQNSLINKSNKDLIMNLTKNDLQPDFLSMFLPTMPEDTLEEIRDVLLATTNNENLLVYVCPNGHRYTIGNCGRPWVKAKCPECKAEIGGQLHKPVKGNDLYTGQDSTQKGHILQKADKGGSPRPERDLIPMHCSAIKLILHMAMFLGPVDQ